MKNRVGLYVTFTAPLWSMLGLVVLLTADIF